VCALSRGQPTYPALEDWIRIFKDAVPNFQDTAAKDPSVPVSLRQVGRLLAASL